MRGHDLAASIAAGQDPAGSIAAGQDLAGRLCLAGARRRIYIAGPEVGPRITTTRGMVAGNIGRAALYPEFMNYRPQVRWGDPGRLLGDGGKGNAAGSPASFVMTDGGMRRARPA